MSTNVQLDFGQLLGTLTLAERAARNAREAAVMRLEAEAAARQPTLAIAGAAVLNQLQHGDGRTLLGDATNPAVRIAREQAEVMNGEMNNLLLAANRLNAMLNPPAAPSPSGQGS